MKAGSRTDRKTSPFEWLTTVPEGSTEATAGSDDSRIARWVTSRWVPSE